MGEEPTSGPRPGPARRLAELDRGQCYACLGTVDLGRLGLSVAALPVVYPVHFRLDGDDVLFSALRDSALADASVGTVAAFQADRIAPDGTGWSVLLQGITGPAAPVGHLRLTGPPRSDPPLVDPPLPDPWSPGAGPVRLLRFRPSTVVGLRRG